MSVARRAMDFDDSLSILTDMIVSEVGPRDALVHKQARIEAVARVERLLEAVIAHTPAHPPARRCRSTCSRWRCGSARSRASRSAG